MPVPIDAASLPAAVPRVTALIVVDVQHDYVDPAGALPCPGAPAILAPINRALAALPFPGGIYYSEDDKLPSDAFGAFPPHCLLGSRGHDKPEGLALSAAAGHVRIPKRSSLSAFGDGPEATPLRALLAAAGANHAVVCGLALELCVLETAAHCVALGLRTAVVREASRAYDPGSPRCTQALPRRLAELASSGLLRVVDTFEEALEWS